MTELKPCPFCGSTNVIRSITGIGCNDCSIFVKPWGYCCDMMDIESMWNRRVN